MQFSNKFVVVVEMNDDEYIHSSYVAAVAVEKDTTSIYIYICVFLTFSFQKSDQSNTSDILNSVDGLSRSAEKNE
jgi:ribosome-binding factor A